MVVVDEQYWFGVYQCLVLFIKGQGVDVLVMMVMLILCMLVLICFGDMDVLWFVGKLVGCKLIKMVFVFFDWFEEIIGWVGVVIQDGQKVYWVCLLVEELEKIDLVVVEDCYWVFEYVLCQCVLLVYGCMSVDEKDMVMVDFKFGQICILVVIIVIEVGVDVLDVIIIVIEYVEWFGFVQLYQLCGWVGWGDKFLFCVLFYKGLFGEIVGVWFNIMWEINDGFIIVEEDLKLCGGGEILGMW